MLHGKIEHDTCFYYQALTVSCFALIRQIVHLMLVWIAHWIVEDFFILYRNNKLSTSQVLVFHNFCYLDLETIRVLRWAQQNAESKVGSSKTRCISVPLQKCLTARGPILVVRSHTAMGPQQKHLFARQMGVNELHIDLRVFWFSQHEYYRMMPVCTTYTQSNSFQPSWCKGMCVPVASQTDKNGTTYCSWALF